MKTLFLFIAMVLLIGSIVAAYTSTTNAQLGYSLGMAFVSGYFFRMLTEEE